MSHFDESLPVQKWKTCDNSLREKSAIENVAVKVHENTSKQAGTINK